MVSRKVLAGAVVAVAVVAIGYFMLVPSEEAEMRRMNSILAKYGVSFPDEFSFDSLYNLSSNDRSSLISELEAFKTDSFFPKPERVLLAAELIGAYAEFVGVSCALDIKDEELSGYFSDFCSHLGVMDERNELESETILKGENLNEKIKLMNEKYYASLPLLDGELDDMREEYARHKDSEEWFKENCGAM